MLKNWATRMRNRFAAFNDDEQGATMLEYILIVAAVALPLLGLIIVFKDKLYDWVTGAWEEATGEDWDSDTTP